MTESIYNNAGMPSGQGAAPTMPEDLRRELAHLNFLIEESCTGQATSMTRRWAERIAEVTLERDTLKAERDTLLRALTHEDAAVIHRVTSKVLAARASTPPPHPINDDEQRRKDAGWNDRPKARCICGEMIAWYSGAYLHVAGRSKSCADGRLASPAHFLVGMPPAEPEWKKGA